MKGLNKFLESIGRGVGKVVGAMYQAGRDTIDQVVTNVLPFMAFIAMIIGIILGTGVGDWIANTLSPLASSLVGLVVCSLQVGIPAAADRMADQALLCPPEGDPQRWLDLCGHGGRHLVWQDLCGFGRG